MLSRFLVAVHVVHVVLSSSSSSKNWANNAPRVRLHQCDHPKFSNHVFLVGKRLSGAESGLSHGGVKPALLLYDIPKGVATSGVAVGGTSGVDGADYRFPPVGVLKSDGTKTNKKSRSGWRVRPPLASQPLESAVWGPLQRRSSLADIVLVLLTACRGIEAVETGEGQRWWEKTTPLAINGGKNGNKENHSSLTGLILSIMRRGPVLISDAGSLRESETVSAIGGSIDWPAAGRSATRCEYALVLEMFLRGSRNVNALNATFVALELQRAGGVALPPSEATKEALKLLPQIVKESRIPETLKQLAVSALDVSFNQQCAALSTSSPSGQQKPYHDSSEDILVPKVDFITSPVKNVNDNILDALSLSTAHNNVSLAHAPLAPVAALLRNLVELQTVMLLEIGVWDSDHNLHTQHNVICGNRDPRSATADFWFRFFDFDCSKSVFLAGFFLDWRKPVGGVPAHGVVGAVGAPVHAVLMWSPR